MGHSNHLPSGGLCARLSPLSYKKKKITHGYLTNLRKILRKKRSHLQKKKILFHHENAPSYTSDVTMAKIHELRDVLLFADDLKFYKEIKTVNDGNLLQNDINRIIS
ncbi:unnamed protein product [Parnassius mnemosyne]|uniref:Histone-lysine N-methyltransferase SETMAR n=1 Tax=Parnassius mnemosyne TaxID=213953 RepID=A0AAV1KSQ7_9NEOP